MQGKDQSSSSIAIRRRRKTGLRVLIVVIAVGLLLADYEPWRVLVAALATYLILMLGISAIGGLARPVPEPPPAGELRRVRLHYRCDECGTEIRMTLANDEVPEAPKHCLEPMVLIVDVEDFV